MINSYEIKTGVDYLYRFLILKLVPALPDRESVYQYLNMSREGYGFLFNQKGCIGFYYDCNCGFTVTNTIALYFFSATVLVLKIWRIIKISLCCGSVKRLYLSIYCVFFFVFLICPLYCYQLLPVAADSSAVDINDDGYVLFRWCCHYYF